MMTDREEIGGLSKFGASAVGFDQMCQCGHRLGQHLAPGTECVVLGCKCGHFRADGVSANSKEE